MYMGQSQCRQIIGNNISNLFRQRNKLSLSVLKAEMLDNETTVVSIAFLFYRRPSVFLLRYNFIFEVRDNFCTFERVKNWQYAK